MKGTPENMETCLKMRSAEPDHALPEKGVGEGSIACLPQRVGISQMHPLIDVHRERVSLVGNKSDIISQRQDGYHQINRHRYRAKIVPPIHNKARLRRDIEEI